MSFPSLPDRRSGIGAASSFPGNKRSWFVSLAAGSLLAFAQCASALTINFNETVSPGNATQQNPSYATSGFTFTALSNTRIYLLDPGYDTSNAPPDNNDFFTIEGGSPSAVDLTSDNPTFSLQSFDAAAIYDDPAGNLTVTGQVSGGGTLTQVFALPSGNPTASWNTYTLPANWNDLTSVTFAWSDAFAGLDNIVVDGSTAAPSTPVPVMPLWLLSVLGGLIGLTGLNRLRAH
jgi:hypothetical protein